MRSGNGDAGPGSGHAMDARSILGVPPLRKTLLVHLSAAEPRETETRRRDGVVRRVMTFGLDGGFDEPDDPDDDDEFEDEDDDDSSDEDEESDDEDDVETWQVLGDPGLPLS